MVRQHYKFHLINYYLHLKLHKKIIKSDSLFFIFKLIKINKRIIKLSLVSSEVSLLHEGASLS